MHLTRIGLLVFEICLSVSCLYLSKLHVELPANEIGSCSLNAVEPTFRLEVSINIIGTQGTIVSSYG